MADEELLPRMRVRIATPTPEHWRYLDAVGRIVDVRDFPPRRFCQVNLQGRDLVWFEANELHQESEEEASCSHRRK